MDYNETLAIDMLAQNTIKRYNPELLKNDPEEVPIEEIIEFQQQLRIVYTTLSKDNTLLGLTIFEDCAIPSYNIKTGSYEALLVKKGTIVIDSKLLNQKYEKELKFTLAHELAHWLVHYNYYFNSNEVASKMAISENESVEEEADLLALSLVLPRGRVKVAYDRTRNKFKKPAMLKIIAETFNVTEDQVKERLINLNLATPTDLGIPVKIRYKRGNLSNNKTYKSKPRISK